MPRRKTPLINGQTYHIYNKGINSQPLFTNKWEYKRALLAINFYKYGFQDFKLSDFLTLSKNKQKDILAEAESDNNDLVKILSFCLMPNHFHLLVRQEKESGISMFMKRFQSSYCHYFNNRQKRKGTVFMGPFKAVLIETEEQLLHISRYIHLNPYSASLVKEIFELEIYPWSSYKEYLSPGENNISDSKDVLSYFGSTNKYRDFVSDHADYQRTLERIKHLIIE
jgi:putative transposase